MAHHLEDFARMQGMSSFVITPHFNGIQVIVVVFKKDDGGAEGRSAEADARAGGEVGRHPVFASSLCTGQAACLIGHDEGIGVDGGNDAGATM